MSNVALFAAEAAPVVVEDGGIVPVLAKLGVILVEMLTPVILLLGSWAAYKLAKKFGIELGVAERAMVKGYIRQAVNATEKWARNQSEKPTSSDKLAKGVDYANQFIKGSGLKKKGSDYLVGLIESQLKWDETPKDK